MTARQIEAARCVARHIKRGGKVWIRVFRQAGHQSSLDPYGQQRATGRVGCGDQPARVLYELEGVELTTAQEAMKLASHKLGIKTRFICATRIWRRRRRR